MSRILCTFPGRHGDLLWALPTVRAIAETTGDPVDLQIAGEFGGLLPLLLAQPYLGSVFADARWGLTPPNAWQAPPAWPPRREGGEAEHFQTPPDPPIAYDKVYQLGYRRWPELPLPYEIDQTVRVDLELPPLDLTRPWIQPPLGFASWREDQAGRRVAMGWTECHFELKYGLSCLVAAQGWSLRPIMSGGRWEAEGSTDPTTWGRAALVLSQADLFLGDCSALHVLAVALGKPVVLVEPMEARWNPIFYPLGMDGPQVTVVKGLDGQPTFDARHCAETLAKVLERTRA